MAHILYEEDYRVAESNGISKRMADDRFYNKMWEKERAITQAIGSRKPSRWDVFKEQCEKVGIKHKTFFKRIERGMSPEEASTKPLDTKYHKRSIT